jgi:hypothetical protein
MLDEKYAKLGPTSLRSLGASFEKPGCLNIAPSATFTHNIICINFEAMEANIGTCSSDRLRFPNISLCGN